MKLSREARTEQGPIATVGRSWVRFERRQSLLHALSEVPAGFASVVALAESIDIPA
jgi:hypothetical protein